MNLTNLTVNFVPSVGWSSPMMHITKHCRNRRNRRWIGTDWNPDLRSWSKHARISYDSDRYNVGSSNLSRYIFSPSVYILRSSPIFSLITSTIFLGTDIIMGGLSPVLAGLIVTVVCANTYLWVC